MNYLLLVWFYIFLVEQNISAENGTDYCKVLNCFEKHVACNKIGIPTTNCPKDARLIQMFQHKENILSIYNAIRNKVAGGELRDFYYGLRMAEMQWSNELAYLAELNVKFCKFKRDRCRSTKAFPNAGQNNAFTIWHRNDNTRSDGTLVMSCINNWFFEIHYSDMFILRKYPPIEMRPLQNHFAIAVTEKNTHIGCAGIRFYKDPYNRFIFTCNFATKNFPNMPVYRYEDQPKFIGKLCKKGKSKTYPNLCSPDEVYTHKRIYLKRK